MVVKAQALYELEDYAECSKLCKEALEIDPDHKRATNLRLRAQRQREMP